MSDRHTMVSNRHPDGRSRPVVFAAALIQPLGICMLPVMLFTLAGMLQGLPVLSSLYAGSPIALVVAAIWTWIRVRDVIVEVHFHDDAMAVRSLIDAASPPNPLEWKRLLDARMSGTERLVLTLGHEEYRLVKSEWTHHPALFSDLPVVQ